ncbi:hypothetical protein D9611_009427 [Ephemerocybe angulata]|uniref:Fungal-type protein kinase domain-containing protein n=1 Tax=Ephemerocybe angulata TaxID=980116 RepID=A0A8H5AVN9_9AGAR|nr:hypothetical protein D9611_009427 [Tulosesus angulatus]
MTLPPSNSRIVSDEQRAVTPLILQTMLEQSNDTVKRPKLRLEPESPTCEEDCMHSMHSNIASVVLNDFDLTALMTPGEKSPQKRGFDRTGTRPFMALDLLESENGSVARLCRCDLESVIWVFPWYCDPKKLADWNDLIRKQAFRARWAWMTTTRVVKPGIPREHAMLLSTSQKILREWHPLPELSEEYNYVPIDSEDEDGELGNDKPVLEPTQHIPDTLDAETQEILDEAAELPDEHYLAIIAKYWQPEKRYLKWKRMDWEITKIDVLAEEIVHSEVED